jgi:sec-independent protein translocase protein TatC
MRSAWAQAPKESAGEALSPDHLQPCQNPSVGEEIEWNYTLWKNELRPNERFPRNDTPPTNANGRADSRVPARDRPTSGRLFAEGAVSYERNHCTDLPTHRGTLAAWLGRTPNPRGVAAMPSRPKHQDYSDDIFDHTRMSFGDHIEVLRRHLLRALMGLGLCLIGGFILDSIGAALNIKSLGVGRPMLEVIVEPAENQVRAFYARRNERALTKLAQVQSDPSEVERIQKKLKDNDFDTNLLTSEEVRILRGAPQEMPVIVPGSEFDKLLQDRYGIAAKEGTKPTDELNLKLRVYPAHLNYFNNVGETILENRQYMKTQSATEAFMVYFKVSLLCGVVLSSPWIFYQLWSFIAAGLYPHEKRHVHLYLPFSVILFITGVLICQFIVLPGAVKALIAFNNWVELDPDMRLNEWLGFALMLPLVFGISFQTPLVMFFFNRIGMISAQAYWSKWRYAVFVLAVFSAIITPTPDIVTMMYLFCPMFGLYVLGAAICHFFPPSPSDWDDEERAAEQVAV